MHASMLTNGFWLPLDRSELRYEIDDWSQMTHIQLDRTGLATLASIELEIAQKIRDEHSYHKHIARSSKGLEITQLEKAWEQGR